jgi:hypothetical protein
MARFAGTLVLAVVAMGAGAWYFWSDGGGDGPTVSARERETFASDRGGVIDSKRAMKYLVDLCKIGPRISGSDGMKKQQDWLKEHFEDFGATVEFQRFEAKQHSRREPIEMANMIVSWHPESKRRVILCCHYDTRPIADQEPDERDWTKPFVSANDGGSGVALLMELAHHMKSIKTEVGVDFVFFDGEEYIFDPGSARRQGDKYFFGSEHFAKVYKQGKTKHRYVAAVLLDMIAGKGARFPIEQNSKLKAGPLVEQLWKIAAEQKCSAFVWQDGPSVLDDHLALNDARIPAVDIIDFDYKHWHRLSDTPENCSEESMAQVARVLVAWLKSVK